MKTQRVSVSCAAEAMRLTWQNHENNVSLCVYSFFNQLLNTCQFKAETSEINVVLFMNWCEFVFVWVNEFLLEHLSDAKLLNGVVQGRVLHFYIISMYKEHPKYDTIRNNDSLSSPCC